MVKIKAFDRVAKFLIELSERDFRWMSYWEGEKLAGGIQISRTVLQKMEKTLSNHAIHLEWVFDQPKKTRWWRGAFTLSFNSRTLLAVKELAKYTTVPGYKIVIKRVEKKIKEASKAGKRKVCLPEKDSKEFDYFIVKVKKSNTKKFKEVTKDLATDLKK